MVGASGSNQTPKTTTASLSFNSSTGVLTAAGFSGPHNGTVGATTASTGAFTTVTATGNITAYYSSDSRLKENIVPIQNALVKIDQITGVNFDWTQDYINRNGGTDSMFLRKNTIGVIAQEIEKVLPEAVADRPDGFKAVRYELIVPLLIQAIKELKSELNEINSKLNK